MILAATAAAACAVAGAAGLSYIFDNHDESKNYETVTVSSTILDKQGVVKCVIHPYSYIYPSFIQAEQYKSTSKIINQLKLNQWKLSMKINQQKYCEFNFEQNSSINFFWSMPLKAHLLQIPAKSYCSLENLNIYERKTVQFSIGIQSDVNENIRIYDMSSEMVLSNLEEYDHTFDSLSLYNPISNDDVIPIGVLKKKKMNISQSDNNHKRFCYDQILDSNQDNSMKNIILKNVNLCVDNLTKILSESCSNNEKQLSTLRDSISYSNDNNNNQKFEASIEQNIYNNISSQFFKDEENLNRHQTCLTNLNNIINFNDQLSDGVILRRGKQYGKILGESMIRKSDLNEDLFSISSHSIDLLNRLLSKANCLLMRQYKIESIEDLIRLFLENGQENFSKIMIHLFKVNSCNVEQINAILVEWARQLT